MMGASEGYCMNEIVSQTSETVRQLADVLGDGDVTIIVQKTPARLIERLAFLESMRMARHQVRRSGLPSLDRLLAYEQINIAEDAGGFIAEYRAADAAEATGMSTRSIRRRHQNLVDAKLIQTHAYGQGAGSRKKVEILVPTNTVAQIAQLLG